jgi:hypothetical protein
MRTEELLRALRICKGAVETTSIYPVFCHFCFSEGGVLHTYNDICAVVTPCDIGVVGGLRGDVLLPLLSTMGNAEVTVKQKKDGAVVLKCGKSESTLVALPKEAFLFQAPDEEDWQLEVEVKPSFFSGLLRCTKTAGADSHHREFTGVAFYNDKGKGLTLYSSDDIRLSRFSAKTSVVGYGINKTGNWLVPGKACTQMAETWSASKLNDDSDTPLANATLRLSKDWLMLEGEDFFFYSKLMPETPPDYPKTLSQVIPKGELWQKAPEAFSAMLKRAEILVGKDMSASIAITVEGKALTARLGEGIGIRYGELNEKIQLAQELDDSVSINVGITKLNEVAADADQVMFSDRCLGVRSKDETYTCWVSPFGDTPSTDTTKDNESEDE